jgi:hypothetical protein
MPPSRATLINHPHPSVPADWLQLLFRPAARVVRLLHGRHGHPHPGLSLSHTLSVCLSVRLPLPPPPARPEWLGCYTAAMVTLVQGRRMQDTGYAERLQRTFCSNWSITLSGQLLVNQCTHGQWTAVDHRWLVGPPIAGHA